MASHGSSMAAVPAEVLGDLTPTAITALNFTTLGLALTCVLARLYTRFCIARKPGWDDLCMTIGALCATAQSILTEVMVNGGLGKHMQDIHTTHWISFFKAAYLSLGFFALSTGFIKAALLLQFLRLFQPKTIAYKAAWGVLVLVLLWLIGFGFISWAPCFPVAKAWHPELPGRCYGLGAVVNNISQFLVTMLAHSASNFAIDLAILGLGAVMILQLGAERPNLRLRLFALLTMGFIVNAVALLRMVGIVMQLVQADKGPVQQDPTWTMAIGVALLNIEINLSAVCASIPVFWAPMQRGVIAQFEKIMITLEVSVAWTTRHRDSCASMDEQGLTRLESSRSGQKFTDNDVALSDISVKSHQQLSHYDDEFVQSYVDPLRLELAGVSETVVRSDVSRKKT